MKDSHKHTPGPWSVSSFDGVHQYAEVTAGDGVQDLVRICDIPSWPCATEEAEANARLIAAAPELLAVLQLLHANAGESPEWIRARIEGVIAKAANGAGA